MVGKELYTKDKYRDNETSIIDLTNTMVSKYKDNRYLNYDNFVKGHKTINIQYNIDNKYNSKGSMNYDAFDYIDGACVRVDFIKIRIYKTDLELKKLRRWLSHLHKELRLTYNGVRYELIIISLIKHVNNKSTLKQAMYIKHHYTKTTILKYMSLLYNYNIRISSINDNAKYKYTVSQWDRNFYYYYPTLGKYNRVVDGVQIIRSYKSKCQSNFYKNYRLDGYINVDMYTLKRIIKCKFGKLNKPNIAKRQRWIKRYKAKMRKVIFDSRKKGVKLK